MPHVVFVPSSPLLVAGPVTGDVPEVLEVREAARAGVDALVASAPERVVVLAVAPSPDVHDETAGGTLRPHGVAVDAGADDRRVLGLGHTVGARLLDDAGWSGPRRYVGAASDVPVLADGDALLVVADGSACRTEKAPGHLDERAEPFDDVLAAALAEGDADVLGGVDEGLAAGVWCTTAAAWRAAGDLVAAHLAAAETPPGPDDDARRGAPAARVRWSGAPLGVGWFVADWDVVQG